MHPRQNPTLLSRIVLCLTLFAPALPNRAASAVRGVLSGELRQWHPVTLTFQGPRTSERAEVNPFKDYRLDVVFFQSDRKLRVPGYYAADGNAAQTGAWDGPVWRVHFAPPTPGLWQYRVEFSTGPNIAIDPDPAHGTPTAFDDTHSSFTVAPGEKKGRDLRARGPLSADGGRYPRFANGEPFLRAGAASPKNLLAFFQFDQTRPTHEYQPHRGDWREGDPAWRGGQGKNIIGALNYLAGKGMNTVYGTALNLRGEGGDVWPWTAEDERYRFDCSKLEQWEIVFSHMERLGLVLHLATQGAGGDYLLDGGRLGLQRKLFYRELAARFAHHPGLIWDLGEGATLPPAQIRAFAQYLCALDPYGHPIIVHTRAGRLEEIFTPLLGAPEVGGISLQLTSPEKVYSETQKWLGKSGRARHPWVVGADDIGGPRLAAPPDKSDYWHDSLRKNALWGALMGGAAGVEWRFGMETPNNALDCENWRSRDHLWELTRLALEFFKKQLPFERMEPHDELLSGAAGHCLALPGQVYALYLPNGGTPRLNLGGVTADFRVQWFNPRNGGPLLDGSIRSVRGPGRIRVGIIPSDPGNEWVVVLKRLN